jgi:ribosomal protein S18 acetylase RimI-like enzyme
MQGNPIKYQINAATERKIFDHLTACNHNFFPPLDERVAIDKYAEKIYEKSITFEAWRGEILVGLVAVYLSLEPKRTAFVTNVSVTKENMRFGLATTLMNMCIDYSRNSGIEKIGLEVFTRNTDVIMFYRKLGFTDDRKENESLFMALEV